MNNEIGEELKHEPGVLVLVGKDKKTQKFHLYNTGSLREEDVIEVDGINYKIVYAEEIFKMSKYEEEENVIKLSHVFYIGTEVVEDLLKTYCEDKVVLSGGGYL